MHPVHDDQEGVALLLDIENESYAVLADPFLAAYDFFDALIALLTCIERLACGMGTVLHRFAAMVIDDRDKKGHFDREKRETVRDILIRQCGYEVALPAFAPGIADDAIIAKTQEIRRAGIVRKWLLVTGDGKHNYTALCRELLIAGHYVHWMSYRAIHGPVHALQEIGRMKFSYSVIASNEVLTQLASLRGGLIDRSAEKIQVDFQSFLRNTRDPNIEERRRKTFEAVIRAVVEISSQRLAEYLDLVGAARMKLRDAHILDVTDAELNAIVHAIMRMDLIQPQTAYMRTPGSRFLEWYQQHLAGEN